MAQAPRRLPRPHRRPGGRPDGRGAWGLRPRPHGGVPARLDAGPRRQGAQRTIAPRPQPAPPQARPHPRDGGPLPGGSGPRARDTGRRHGQPPRRHGRHPARPLGQVGTRLRTGADRAPSVFRHAPLTVGGGTSPAPTGRLQGLDAPRGWLQGPRTSAPARRVTPGLQPRGPASVADRHGVDRRPGARRPWGEPQRGPGGHVVPPMLTRGAARGHPPHAHPPRRKPTPVPGVGTGSSHRGGHPRRAPWANSPGMSSTRARPRVQGAAMVPLHGAHDPTTIHETSQKMSEP
jgi:hypothetical protein